MRQRVQNLRHLAWGLGAVAVMGVSLWLILPRLHDRERLIREHRVKQEDNRRVAEETHKRNEMLRRLATEPAFAERVAHEFGWVKTNEVLFKFPKDG